MLAGVADEGVNGAHHRFQNVSGAAPPVSGQKRKEASVAVLLFLVVLGLDHAVREDHKNIARLECDRAGIIRCAEEFQKSKLGYRLRFSRPVPHSLGWNALHNLPCGYRRL